MMKNLLSILLLALVAACGGGGDASQTAPSAPVASIETSQSTLLFTAAGQEKQLSARTLDSAGLPVDAGVTWTSSAPEQISVDAGGKVRSVTEIGSAQVSAEVGGVRSAPIFVASVALRPNTLLLRDANVIEVLAPATLPADGFPALGTVFEVLVAGIPAPAAGTLVLATETAAVAGRVLASTVEGAQLRLRLEPVSAPELLARYDVNWVIDLAAYASVMDGEPLTPSLQPPGEPGRPRALEARAADTPVVPKWKVPSNGSSPLSCEGSTKAFLKSKPVQVSFEGSPKLEIISSRLTDGLPPGRLRIALVGDLVMVTTVGLTAEAGLKGEITCELQGRVPLPFQPPPIGPFVRLAVPVGIGASISGEVQIASMDFSLEGKNGARLELGIDCGPAPAACRSLDRAERINEFTPKAQISSAPLKGLGIKLDAQVYLLSGLDVVALGKPFNIVEVKAGPKQAADFGSVLRQTESTTYLSNYDLKFKIEVGPGSALKTAIDKLMGGEDRGSLTFSFPLTYDISESPNGTLQTDRSRVIPGTPVTLSVDLKPASLVYFNTYNVKAIRIYRRLEGAMLFKPFKTIEASASNQSHFETTWEPTGLEAGKNEFAAFVITKLLPVIEPELEIAPDSIKVVQVDCLAAAPAGAGRARAQATGSSCGSSYVGTASGLIPGLFGYQASLSWALDTVRNNDPSRRPYEAFYRPNGSVRVDFLVYTQLGCTVTPSDFSRFDDVSVLYISTSTSPPSYGFLLSVHEDLTINCPDSPPLVIPSASAVSFSGSGVLTPSGEITGSTVTPQGNSSYRFAPPSP